MNRSDGRRTLVLQQLYEHSVSSFFIQIVILLCHSDTSLPQHRLRRNLRVLECKMGKYSRRQLYCRAGSIELPTDAVSDTTEDEYMYDADKKNSIPAK
ncbi:MAG: hypothetical protein M3352_10460 [Bacteroidota bacterium]|nr:hypothetical protein [Bacteroidota bacterium]